MNYIRLVVFAISAPVCFAAGAVPNAAAKGVIDRLFEAIKSGALPPNDLKILEHAAEGRFAEPDVAVVLSLGVGRNDFSPLAFAVDDVRAHAYRRIGESGLPEAVRYLSGVRVSDVGTDYSQHLWPAVRIALHVALVNSIPEKEAKLAFLRKSMTERDTGFIDGAVQGWALNELCDAGDRSSLPEIRRWLKNVYAGSPGEEGELRYCESRMEVLSRSPDRVQAIATVLRTNDEAPDTYLMAWAVAQLDALHTVDARRELARFAAELAKMPKDSPARRRLLAIELGVQQALARWSR